MEKILDSLLKGTVDTGKKNIADDHAIQANDQATQIVNCGNPNDAKVQLLLKLEDLRAERQKWIDNELAKYGPLGSTGAMMKSTNELASARYDARIKSLETALANL